MSLLTGQISYIIREQVYLMWQLKYHKERKTFHIFFLILLLEEDKGRQLLCQLIQMSLRQGYENWSQVLLWQCAHWADGFGHYTVPFPAIVCLLALFITKKGALRAPTIVVELFCFSVLSVWGWFLYPDILLYKCLWLLSLGEELKLKWVHNILFISQNILDSQSLLSDNRIVPMLSFGSFTWNIPFHPLLPTSCRLDLKGASWRQHSQTVVIYLWFLHPLSLSVDGLF